MSETEQTSTFDEWIKQASVKDLRREADEKETELDRVIQQVKTMEAQARSLHEEVLRRRRVLEVLEEIQPAPKRGSSAPAGQLSKREMAMRILEDSLRGMFPREVRDQAVERGWIENTPAASNQLSVAMSKALKQGKLHRDEEGRYSIPRDDEGEADELVGHDVGPPQLLVSNASAEAQ